MEENKFFKFVKRFNTIIFAALGLFIAFWLIRIFAGEFDNYNPEGKLNSENELVADPDKLNVNFSGQLPGQDLFAVSLKLDSAGSGGGFSKGYSPDRQINRGVYSVATGQTQWMFPDNNQLIFGARFLVKNEIRDSEEQLRTATGHLLRIANNDTNNDGQFSDRDLMSLWTFSPDGTNGKMLIDNIIEKTSLDYLNGDRAVIFYETKEGLFSSQLDLNSLELLNTHAIELP